MLSTVKRFAQPVVLPVVLPFSFGHFFRRQLTIGQARSLLMRALENREERFLEVAREEIYGQAASPYLELLNLAGCEYGDLRAGVLKNGLEATLQQLAADGVYFTDSEFRGLTDTVRSGSSFRVAPEDF